MGATQSKTTNKLVSINKNVSSVRQSIRSSTRMKEQNRKSLLEYMVKQTDEVNDIRKKIPKKKYKETIDLITKTTEELLVRDNPEFSNAEETNPRKSVVKKEPNSEPKRKTIHLSSVDLRKSTSHIEPIDAKINNLKPLVVTAIENEDKKQLRLYRETVKIMFNDLEQIPTGKNDETRIKTEKKIRALYAKIDKAYKDISRNQDLKYLSNIDKDKAWKELQSIEQELGQTNSEIQSENRNLENARISLQAVNKRLNSINPIDESIKMKRVQLATRCRQLSISLDNLESSNSNERNSRKAKSKSMYVERFSDDEIDTNLKSKLHHRSKESLNKIKAIDTFAESLKTIENDMKTKSYSAEDMNRINDFVEVLQMKKKSSTEFIPSENEEVPIYSSVNKKKDRKSNLENSEIVLNAVQDIRNTKEQLDYINEKVNNNQINQNMVNTIQKAIRKLQPYEKFSDENVSSSATSLIFEANSILDRINDPNEKVLEIHAEIKDVSKQVENVDVDKDEETVTKIFATLERKRKELEAISIPDNEEVYKKCKFSSLQMIQVLNQKLLESLMKSPQNDEYFKQLAKITRMIERYSGSYQDTLFTEIEMKLNGLLSSVIDKVHNRQISQILAMEIEKCSKILEERAAKTMNYNNRPQLTKQTAFDTTVKPEEKKLMRLEQNWKKIENSVKTFTGLPSSDDYMTLDSEILTILTKLEKLKFSDDDEDLKERCKLLIEDINENSKFLQQRVKAAEILTRVEKKIDFYDDNLDDISDDEREDVEDDLNQAKDMLGGTIFTKELQQRKKLCIQRIDNKLKEVKKSV